MSEEQLKAFLEAIRGDAALQEQLKAASDADAVVAIAKAAGFVISADDLKSAQSGLSEEELEGVAGGTISQYGQYQGLPCKGALYKAADAAQVGIYNAANKLLG